MSPCNDTCGSETADLLMPVETCMPCCLVTAKVRGTACAAAVQDEDALCTCLPIDVQPACHHFAHQALHVQLQQRSEHSHPRSKQTYSPSLHV